MGNIDQTGSRKELALTKSSLNFVSSEREESRIAD